MTSVTFYTGDMGDSFATKGLSALSIRQMADTFGVLLRLRRQPRARGDEIRAAKGLTAAQIRADFLRNLTHGPSKMFNDGRALAAHTGANSLLLLLSNWLRGGTPQVLRGVGTPRAPLFRSRQ